MTDWDRIEANGECVICSPIEAGPKSCAKAR